MNDEASTSGSGALRLGTAGFVGLCLTTMSALMFEILVTRIFSVTMWYHFAFVAISIAMFGTSAGALTVYLRPGFFRPELAKRQLAVFALLFSVSIPLSFVVMLMVRIKLDDPSLYGIFQKILVYAGVAIPFTLAGICVCLALTKFAGQVSRLYAIDLLGAALGCLLLVLSLDAIGDAPTVLILLGAIAALGSTFFAWEARGRLFGGAVALTVGLSGFALLSGTMLEESRRLIGVDWVKGHRDLDSLYERWSSYSRVTVTGDEDLAHRPTFWGMSPVFAEQEELKGTKVRELLVLIDAAAGTTITKFDGDLDSIEFLKYDIINLAHHLRPGSDVAVIGVGGGRDILSALAFRQASVQGIEINQDILRAVTGPFGDFAGHLEDRDGVSLSNADARSWLTRTDARFDIIQASLIDTWAATAAGAFVLSENSLYTVEAWQMFLDRLKPGGVLTFSRWYAKTYPDEMYRMMALAVEALSRSGAANPRGHIFVATVPRKGTSGAGTMIVSRDPLSETDQDLLENLCKRLRYDVVVTPRVSPDPGFARIANPEFSRQFIEEFPRDLSPPTDNRPFFFNTLRFRDVFNPEFGSVQHLGFNLKAVSILGSLFVVVLIMTLLFILVPLFLTRKNVEMRGGKLMLLYFASIGLGYILIEISQLQRLVVFLGHPTYGLSVVLFSMLVSSGLGSYTTNAIGPASPTAWSVRRLLLLVASLVAYAILSPCVLAFFRGEPTVVRIVVAGGILFPIGFFMGMAFPVGMKFAETRMDSLTAWFWGINGAASVLASVLTLVLSLGFGISVAFWAGVICYLGALGTFGWSASRAGVAS